MPRFPFANSESSSQAQANPLTLEAEDIVEARLGMRVLAFLLDIILAIAIIVLLLNKVVLPSQYGPELKELDTALSTYSTQLEDARKTGAKPPTFEISPKAKEMLEFTRMFIVGSFWVYFLVNAIATQGSSLGKRVFRLRVISIQTLEPLGFLESGVRSGIKAMTLCLLFPLLLTNYLIAFCNKRRLTGHDYLCRSIVIEDIDFEELQNRKTRPEEA
ncbi:MAG TPA: hypothetical protein DIU37_04295 [Opitutae bacterium]|nr:hypothetical protein [Opitutae bacterium]|tara:strand:+ start:7018 stop:7668 length:651 start_codon:yes stop_codon:yes gene_type:complete